MADRGDADGTNTTRLAVGGVAVVLLIIILLQNQEEVRVQALFWTVAFPTWLALLLAALLGALIGQAVGMWRKRRKG